jgi:hypothetical protein
MSRRECKRHVSRRTDVLYVLQMRGQERLCLISIDLLSHFAYTYTNSRSSSVDTFLLAVPGQRVQEAHQGSKVDLLGKVSF